MNPSIEQIDDLLKSLHERYGYDFQNYARASIERRLEYFAIRHEIEEFEELKATILKNPGIFHHFVRDITVQVTEMFRDFEVFQTIREKVLPILATYPRIKIWHAGCSSGEEVYSMAIILHEANLLERSLLYATDINDHALKAAHQGQFPLKSMQTNSRNYLSSGGQASLSDYYTASSQTVQMAQFLRKRIVFSFHNLATDTSFAEVHMVICRNVLIYFNENLQNRVISLLEGSLIRKGFLVLGNKETLGITEPRNLQTFSSAERIYRDVG